MSIVGLTGGFGSGKSFVASLFKKRGAKVIDADKLARKALVRGSRTYKEIVGAFGESILGAHGAINRRALAKAVFGSRRKLARLNRIVHPGVIRSIKDRIRSAGANDILVLDAPLICEANLTGLMNILVVVKSSKRNQIDRCVSKFNMKEDDVCKRIECQMPLKKKLKLADYVIDNNGTKMETEKQVGRIWKDIKKGA
jgi:dephospho-CoA kinase